MAWWLGGGMRRSRSGALKVGRALCVLEASEGVLTGTSQGHLAAAVPARQQRVEVRRSNGRRDPIRRATSRACSAKPNRGLRVRQALGDVLIGRGRQRQALARPARPENGLRGRLRRAAGRAHLRRVVNHVCLRRNLGGLVHGPIGLIHGRTGLIRSRTSRTNPLAARAEKIRVASEGLGLACVLQVPEASGNRFGRGPTSGARASREKKATSSGVLARVRVSGPGRESVRASRVRRVFLGPSSARLDPRRSLRLAPGRNGARSVA